MKNVISLCLSLLIITGQANSQLRQNEMLVVQNTPISFSYVTAEDLLLPKIISNAFDLKITGGSDVIKVYASMIMQGAGKNADVANLLSLKLNYMSSSSVLMNISEVPLMSTPVLLFTIPRGSAASLLQHQFIYDVKLAAPKTFVKPAEYNFSIIFTQSIQ